VFGKRENEQHVIEGPSQHLPHFVGLITSLLKEIIKKYILRNKKSEPGFYRILKLQKQNCTLLI